MIVMRLHGLINGIPTEHDGRWLLDYDPRPLRWQRPMILRTTDELGQAKRFSSLMAAFECYTWIIGRRLWDGKPDRPLTAYTVEFIKEERAQEAA